MTELFEIIIQFLMDVFNKKTGPCEIPDEQVDATHIAQDEVEVISEEKRVVVDLTDKEYDGDTIAPTKLQRIMWCLDNGHGSKTAGKRSPKFEDGRQLLEWEWNRKIVRGICKALDELGIKYFNVVPEDDTDNFLEGRVDRANNYVTDLPKIFVSVHGNAGPAKDSKSWCLPSINGIETWYYHGSSQGRKVASIFQKKLIEKTGRKSRGLKSKEKGQFYVLRKTRFTSVLTENGFYNNKNECEWMLSEQAQQQIIDAHVEGILHIEEHGI